jgi:hypothetical protein
MARAWTALEETMAAPVENAQTPLWIRDWLACFAPKAGITKQLAFT